VLTETSQPETEARPVDESRVVAVEHLSLAFDDKVILKDVNFAVPRGHTKIILGASGAGKSLTLKILIGLLKADSGTVLVEGARVDTMTEPELMAVRNNVGMVFQEGALFDSLTVRENVGYRLYEETDMPLEDVNRRVEEVLGFVSLAEFIDRMPSALSGGQRRRVAIARALASKPRIVLYDEATTGLDPITATTVDDEVIKLRDLHEVTSILVTHQLRDAFYVATNTAVRDPDGTIRIVPASPEKESECEFVMLRDGVIAFEGDAKALRDSKDEYIRRFLS